MADPLSHSERNVEYHGAVWPPGSQLTMGRNPNAVPTTAERTAAQRQCDDCVEDSRLATEHPVEKNRPTGRPVV